LKLLLDGAAHFLGIIPEFIHGVGSFVSWLARLFAPLIIALIIAYLLDPVVNYLQRVFDNFIKKKLPEKLRIRKKNRAYKNRVVGTTLTYFFILILIGALIAWLINKLNLSYDYLDEISAAADNAKNNFSEAYAAFQIRLRELGLLDDFIKILDRAINGISGIIQSTTNSVISSLTALGGHIVKLLIGFFMAFYLLSSKESMLSSVNKFSVLFLPKRLRARIHSVLKDIHGVFSGYISGQLLNALIMSILASILLSVTGVDFAIIIGILVGFFNIIPYFGAVLGFLIAVVAALISVEPIKVLYTAIGIIVLQQIDVFYVTPKVVGKHVELSPFMVLLALSVGSTLFGVLGLLLAVPVCAIAKIFILRYIDYRCEQLNIDDLPFESESE